MLPLHSLVSYLLFLAATSMTAMALKERPYDVFWNVPTFMCRKYGIEFNVTQYGIKQNTLDEFRGEEVLILYDPGLFPAFLSDEEQEPGSIFGRQSNVVARNGGLPQLGNLTVHLRAMRKVVNQLIPDKDFSGVGVVDFESWRPTFRQNWASLNIYRDKSRALERREHPHWPKEHIEKEAERRFEHFGRVFMERTLHLVREMRPKARWGYYAFPYCFNYTPKNQGFDCPTEVKKENNDLGWMYEASDVLFPSLYMSRQKLRPEQHHKFVYGRLSEAQRLANRVKPSRPDVMPYVWYRYYDEQEYLTVDDLLNCLGTPKTLGLAGAVLWGSAKDVNTRDRCLALQRFVDEHLGPVVRHVRSTHPDQLEERLTAKEGRADLHKGFWATYFIDPITAILNGA